MSGSSNNAFTFGLEIELLVKPKKELMPVLRRHGWNSSVTPDPCPGQEQLQHKNRHALRASLASVFTEAGVPASISSNEYKEWTIADEGSLFETSSFWRVEFISRVLSTQLTWAGEVDRVYDLINRYCDVRVTTGCSTHVHVCPEFPPGASYTQVDAVKMMKAMVYFDEPITKMMPPERKQNIWAAPIASNSADIPAVIANAYQQVPLTSWEPLFDLLERTVMKRSETRWKPMLMIELFTKKYMSWNFRPLEQCGTIEFRRPPGAARSAEAKHWVAFALGFAAAARNYPWQNVQSSRTKPSVKELEATIKRGALSLGRTTYEALNKSLLAEDTSPATLLTAAQLRHIQMLKEKDKNKESPFAKKASSRPNSPASSRSSSSSSRRK